jgi:uncharacterized Fe-S cluster-containing radical SAM superfamily protein
MEPVSGRVPLGGSKFRDPGRTARGEPRARVTPRGLETLWLNTGTLCNVTCAHCYIESSPSNDRLAYLRLADVTPFLDEIRAAGLGTRTIGLTGGEPFMNPEILAILAECLERGFRALVLTNAMRPLQRRAEGLRGLRERHPAGLALRVSLDHHTREAHEAERGPKSFEAALAGLAWLVETGFDVAVAGRAVFGAEDEASLRAGYARLFAARGLPIDARDPARLILFPEMDPAADVPEVSMDCFRILGVDPGSLMCASSRMVVRRRGADRPVVVPCTLLPYDPRFELGRTLGEAAVPVPLNHPFCAQFCVLGRSSCSG